MYPPGHVSKAFGWGGLAGAFAYITQTAAYSGSPPDVVSRIKVHLNGGFSRQAGCDGAWVIADIRAGDPCLGPRWCHVPTPHHTTFVHDMSSLIIQERFNRARPCEAYLYGGAEGRPVPRDYMLQSHEASCVLLAKGVK